MSDKRKLVSGQQVVSLERLQAATAPDLMLMYLLEQSLVKIREAAERDDLSLDGGSAMVFIRVDTYGVPRA